MINKIWKAEECINSIRSKKGKVLSVLGYSASEYERPNYVDRKAVQFLRNFDPNIWVVNAGGSAMGIGRVYEIASRLGFRTIGIVSALVLEEEVPLSSLVDEIYLIEDNRWGGFVDQSTSLSNTSKVIVEVSQRILAIGGNRAAHAELAVAMKQGIEINFVPADMNHDLAAANDIPRKEWPGMASILFAE